MRILVGEFIEGFKVQGDLGFSGDEMVLLQVPLQNLNTLQRSEGPNVVAKAVHQGFWLGTNKDDKNPEQTLEKLKKTLAEERIRFFRVFKVRNSSRQSEQGGKVWVSNSKSSYAGNFVQLGLIYKEETGSTYYLFRRTKGHIDFWTKTEDLALLKQHLKALGQENLLAEAVKEKKALIREKKAPDQRLEKNVEEALKAIEKASEKPPVKKNTKKTTIPIKEKVAV